MLRNNNLIEMTKEITIARLSNTNLPISREGAQNIADFMEVIYDKLAELNNKEVSQ